MKTALKFILPCALAVLGCAPAAHAAPVITDWTSVTLGTTGSASGTLGGLSVSFSGDVRDLQNNHGTVFDNAVYGGQTVYTPNLDVSDAIGTWGTPGGTNTITFSSAVMNPILWINSLGRGGGWPTSYIQTWTFDSAFSLLSSWYVPVAEGANPYQMTQSGNSLIGQEGHGAIQFTGTYTSISWTSNTFEQSAYFQVGYDTANGGGPAPASVPEQASLALVPIALGFLLLAQSGLRRRNGRA